MLFRSQEIQAIATACCNATWAMQGAHPDNPNGIRMWEQSAYTNHYANMIPGMAASIAAIANNQDITPEELKIVINEAMPTAEQMAGAFIPLVEEITQQVLGADNSNLAREILKQLREALPISQPN